MNRRGPKRRLSRSALALLPWVGLALWAATGTPVWARGNDCSFRSSSTLLLDFGTLDPSAASRAQQRAAAARAEDLQAGDCAPGAQMRIQVEGGLHDAGGQLRMRHIARADTFLRYAVQVEPALQRGPGNQRFLTFELVGRLETTDVAAAPGGAYQDILRLTVTP